MELTLMYLRRLSLSVMNSLAFLSDYLAFVLGLFFAGFSYGYLFSMLLPF
jgi:hypothetical protein